MISNIAWFLRFHLRNQLTMERRPAELGRIAAVIFLLINFGVIISESLVIGKKDDIEGIKGIIWLFQAKGLMCTLITCLKRSHLVFEMFGIWVFSPQSLTVLSLWVNCEFYLVKLFECCNAGQMKNAFIVYCLVLQFVIQLHFSFSRNHVGKCPIPPNPQQNTLTTKVSKLWR